MAALAAGIGACAAKPLDRPLPLGPAKSGPGTIAEARKYLQGKWTFVSMEIFPAGQPPIFQRIGIVGLGLRSRSRARAR